MLSNKINRALLTLLISVSLLLFTVACKPKEHSSDNQAYGSVTARVVWPGSTDAQSSNSQAPLFAGVPDGIGIDHIEARVNGSGMTEVIKEFDFNTPGKTGAIDKIPIGSDRTLIIYGKDTNDNAIFETDLMTLPVIEKDIITNAGTLVWKASPDADVKGAWGVTYWGNSRFSN